MVMVKPTTFTAARPFTLKGVAIAKNTVLTAPQVRSIPNLNALVDAGWIKCQPDPHQRRQQHLRKIHSAQTMLKSRSGITGFAAYTAPEPDVDAYPVDGTIPEIKEWVGDSDTRAYEALTAENLRSTPRSTLVSWLESLVEQEEESRE